MVCPLGYVFKTSNLFFLLKAKTMPKSKGIDTERKNSKKIKKNTKTDSF